MAAIEAIDIGGIKIIHPDRDGYQQEKPEDGGGGGRELPAKDKPGNTIGKGDHACAGQEVEAGIALERVHLTGKIGSELAGGALHLAQQPVFSIVVAKKEAEQENEQPGDGSEAAVEAKQEQEDSGCIGHKK